MISLSLCANDFADVRIFVFYPPPFSRNTHFGEKCLRFEAKTQFHFQKVKRFE